MHRAVDRPPVPAAACCQAWQRRRAVSAPVTISLVNLGGARGRRSRASLAAVGF